VDGWSAQLLSCERWLHLIRSEWEAPDLWAQLQRERTAVGGPASGVENAPFTEDELGVSAQIRELKEYVRTAHDLEEGQLREIDARLDHVEHTARQGIGRVDWWNLLVGTLFNLVVQIPRV
jgi:hypothetical protein